MKLDAERRERMKILLGHISVEEVLSRYDFEIADRSPSRKGGEELHGSCPFHLNNSENFSINSSSGRWLCRSTLCSKRGDLIRFTALKERCSDDRAYRLLCGLAGVDPSDFSPLAMTMSIITQIGRREGTQKAEKPIPMALPHGYFVVAHPYLVEARGIDPVVLVDAGAGGVLEDEFYKYRACMPVKMRDKVYSLYARACGPVEPRHHYSGQSLTSHLLYGLDDVIGSEVILVEAIISVLKLRTLGITNAISVLGGGISKEQIKLLIKRRGISTVRICLDNDEKLDEDTGETFNPGMKAAWATYRKLKNYFDVGVVKLPINRDPADMDDADEFRECYATALWPQHRARKRRAIQEFFAGG